MPIPTRTSRLYDPSNGSAPESALFADLPAASAAAGELRVITDLNDAVLRSDGTRWRPLGGRQVIAQAQAPISLVSGGSVAANGALTLTTALKAVHPGWIYLQAGQAYAGSPAGFYWVVMSTTSAGTIYDNIYVPSNRNWTPPTVPTPVVAAGPGAFTGITATVTAVEVAIPANLLGPFGALETFFRISTTSSAGNKILYSKFNSADMYNTGAITYNTGSFADTVSFANQGNTNRQASAYLGDSGKAAASLASASINTTAATTAAITLAHAAADDFIELLGYYVELVG